MSLKEEKQTSHKQELNESPIDLHSQPLPHGRLEECRMQVVNLTLMKTQGLTWSNFHVLHQICKLYPFIIIENACDLFHIYCDKTDV